MDVNSFNALLANPGTQALLIILGIWSLVWKGFALWKAARNSQRNWFLAMLIINSVGILEIVYLFYFSRKKNPPVPPQTQ